MEKIAQILRYIEEHDLYPDLRIIQGAATPEVTIDGKKVLMFSSNNYLSLANHPKVIQAAIEATQKYGTGSGGSRLLSGNLEIHRQLEEKLVQFKGGEDALLWPVGYSANIGTISAVMKLFQIPGVSFMQRKGVIFSDQLNHASIIDGARMVRQKIVVYRHCDMDDLERKLKKYRSRRKLIVTDGVFSMDGDIAPLDKIAALAKKYHAITMVDEAHATGVIGKTGKGTLEHFGLKPIKDVDIVMGTLGKALGGEGGFVVGSKTLVKYLRVASRSYMFSTTMPPAVSAAGIAALEVIEQEPIWMQKLHQNTRYLREGFQKLGYDTLTSETQIIPILIGDDDRAIRFSRLLFEKGIFGPCVRWPAVEKGRARLRVTLMSSHTRMQMDKLLKSCEEIGKLLKLSF